VVGEAVGKPVEEVVVKTVEEVVGKTVEEAVGKALEARAKAEREQAPPPSYSPMVQLGITAAGGLFTFALNKLFN
jgi:hypothetical protein